MIDLARNRPEFLNPLFRFLNYFDTVYFFFALIPILWIGFSYKWGLRIFYWFTLSSIVNTLAKYLVGWPRPSTDLPEIGLFTPNSPGFPSGGAQTCMFLGAILIYYWKTRAAWLIGTFYILLISFSRLYLGVHYPIDVLGGWAIGVLLFYLFVITKEPLENYLVRKGAGFCLVISLAIPVALTLVAPHQYIFPIAGTTLGVGLGTYFSLQKHLFLAQSKTMKETIIRSFIALSTFSLFIYLWPKEQSFAKSFSAGLFMSFAASPICRWFISRKR